VLIGLASKNAILIVEFANQLRERGLSITKAALEAAPLATNSDDSFAALLGFGLSSWRRSRALSRQSLVPLFSAVLPLLS